MEKRLIALAACSLLFLLLAGCSQPGQQAGAGNATQITPASPASNPPAAPAVPAAANGTYINQSAPGGAAQAANNTANGTGTINTTGGADNRTGTNQSAPEMKRGVADSSFKVATYNEEKAFYGTTLLPDNHNTSKPRVIEVNMLGEIIWEYDLPPDLKQYTNPGFDAEMLPSGNVLMLLPRKGAYEINRNGSIVWSYVDGKVSHDADRLPNGNTLVAYGAFDRKEDAQAKEVSPEGRVVWSYYAKNYFGETPAYTGISQEGWTHTNAVQRRDNGDTLVSHRNFNLIAVVGPQGSVTRTISNSAMVAQHDPVLLENGNILFATHTTPQKAVEIDANGTVVWSFSLPEKNSWPVRDADRLPNNNTLITAADRIIEVTPDGEVVWDFRLVTTFKDDMDHAARGFYKAERLPP